MIHLSTSCANDMQAISLTIRRSTRCQRNIWQTGSPPVSRAKALEMRPHLINVPVEGPELIARMIKAVSFTSNFLSQEYSKSANLNLPASDHPRGEGMRIRGIANEFSFGHERDVNSFSTKPGCSSPTLSSYEEEPRWEGE